MWCSPRGCEECSKLSDRCWWNAHEQQFVYKQYEYNMVLDFCSLQNRTLSGMAVWLTCSRWQHRLPEIQKQKKKSSKTLCRMSLKFIFFKNGPTCDTFTDTDITCLLLHGKWSPWQQTIYGFYLNGMVYIYWSIKKTLPVKNCFGCVMLCFPVAVKQVNMLKYSEIFCWSKACEYLGKSLEVSDI